MALMRFVSTLQTHCSHRLFVCIPCASFFWVYVWAVSFIGILSSAALLLLVAVAIRVAHKINRITSDKNRWRRDEKQNEKEGERQCWIGGKKRERERGQQASVFSMEEEKKRRWFHVLIRALCSASAAIAVAATHQQWFRWISLFVAHTVPVCDMDDGILSLLSSRSHSSPDDSQNCEWVQSFARLPIQAKPSRRRTALPLNCWKHRHTYTCKGMQAYGSRLWTVELSIMFARRALVTCLPGVTLNF